MDFVSKYKTNAAGILMKQETGEGGLLFFCTIYFTVIEVLPETFTTKLV